MNKTLINNSDLGAKPAALQTQSDTKSNNVSSITDQRPEHILQGKLKSIITGSPVKHNVLTPNNTTQRVPDAIDMNAGEGDLLKSYKRKSMVDGIYNHIKSNQLFYKFTTLAESKTYLETEYKGSGYKKFNEAEEEDKEAMVKEILARIYHDQTASAEITPEMRAKLGKGYALSEEEEDTVGPDIQSSIVTPPKPSEGKENFEIDSKLTTAKACVITALMFSEGGGVLGAKSIEELHFILSTRFGTTWRHYSEDKVYKSLYEHMGYHKTVVADNIRLENLSTAIDGNTSGMVSIEGHMVGFKKEGEILYIRDNDEGLKLPNQHSKRAKKILDYWTK